ncbi:MAG TPA: hypothetical protein VKZ79_07375, partial [Alphaproteobacteria bacterium]|nr:hypothetical protein [Alphaproteobacteria bacterium]
MIARAGRFAALAATLVCLDVAGASTLGTESQRAREELALKVLASGPVQEQLARTETLYGQSQPSRTPSGKSTIESAAKSIALASVQYALSEDGSHPVAMWSCNAPHRWFGLDVPRSGYGVDNPDNVYRWVAIDGVSKYEIRGHMKEPGPLQETFILYSSIPGMNPMNREGAGMVGTLRSDQMSIGPDGSFTITIDPDPAGGRPNHIQSNSTAKLLIVRDTLSDWSKQNPV